MKSNSESLNPNTFRLPAPIQIAAVLGIAIPVGMLTHLSFAERESLEETVVSLEGDNAMLVGEKQSLVADKAQLITDKAILTSERDAFALLSRDVGRLRAQLEDSHRDLGLERDNREMLEVEVALLSDRVSLLVEREDALHGIIDLLEDEVESAENRLEAIAAGREPHVLDLEALSAAAITASNDPQVRQENQQLRNELNRHDQQVAELLGEIGILNQELELMRGERSKLNQQVRQLSAETQQHRQTLENGLSSGALAGLGDDE